MRIIIVLLLLSLSPFSKAQLIDSLNTAKKCLYMTAPEREMIYEINRLRSDPKSFIPYLTPLLNAAEENQKEFGKGSRHYSLTLTHTYENDKTNTKIDTNWFYTTEEYIKSLTTLISDLKKLKPLSVLKPDEGSYKAASKHSKDQNEHAWSLMHTGSDGSSPWDRITFFSPTMSFGNENIAGSSGISTPRSTILQLLIDEGIPGYGHRYNLLDAQWTHVACKTQYHNGMTWWIQNFGVKKKN